MEIYLQNELDTHNKKTTLNTNIEPAKPFIYGEKKSLFSKLFFDELHYYHVTTYKNISSIIQKGLDPTYGGEKGAADRVRCKGMIEQSRGLVHATYCKSGTATYIDLYEKSGFSLGWYPDFPAPNHLKDSAIVLRFSKKYRMFDGKEMKMMKTVLQRQVQLSLNI